MLQIQSLSLGNLCIPVATSHILNVLQTSTLPPLSWDNSVVVTLKTAVELTFVIYFSLELSRINVSHYFVFSITHVAWLKKLTEESL